MGNYRFKLSDMMPNAWFYKLKDMGRVKNNTTTPTPKKKKQQNSASATQTSKANQPHQHHPRKSYYFTRELIPSDRFSNSPTNPKDSSDTHFPTDPPRKSTKQRVKKRTGRSSPKVVTSSVSAGCHCKATLNSVWTKSDSPSSSPFDSSTETEFHEPEFRSDRILATESFDEMVSFNDIVIDMDKESFASKVGKIDGFDVVSELELPPIITKPVKFSVVENKETKEPTKFRRSSSRFEETNAHGSVPVKVVKEERITMKEQRTIPVKRFSVNSPGVKLRINSPRIASKKIQAHGGRRSVSSTSSSGSRRSLSDSCAIVKSSFDPQKDFRNSMVEMIVENNIKASKDLEDLLACYLSLNSDEYHDLIIKVFKQIWFDLTDIQLK